MVDLSACPGRREVGVWASHWCKCRSGNVIGLTKVVRQGVVRAQHGPYRPVSQIRAPPGGLSRTSQSYDKIARTAVCFEHKTQYILICAPYTRIVVFWHITNIPPMIRRVKLLLLLYIAIYCYTTGSWLLQLMSKSTVFGLLSARGKLLWNRSIAVTQSVFLISGNHIWTDIISFLPEETLFYLVVLCENMFFVLAGVIGFLNVVWNVHHGKLFWKFCK